MNLAYKQLFKETLKNKLFISLMLLLTVCTSFMYFFVHFSIDGNLRTLNQLSSLSENQLLYKNALVSNTILATNILLAFILLTGFVFVMFFYRFFKKNSKVIGTLKSLGFKDAFLRKFFVYLSFGLSLLGGLVGLMGGYLMSDTLLQASIRSYQVSDLVKVISLSTLLIGICLPTLVFCIITFCMYRPIQSKELSLLLTPLHTASRSTPVLRLAHTLANLWPTKNKFPIRLALRKPIPLLLILTAVTTFSVMFILAYSLNLSSGVIYDTQTKGHHYLVDTTFDAPHTFSEIPADSMPYSHAEGTITFGDTLLSQDFIAFPSNSTLFELYDSKGQTLPLPTSQEIVISPALAELYDLQVGDTLVVEVSGNHTSFVISHIVANAKLNTLYLAPEALASLLALPPYTYTSLWSMEPTAFAGTVITSEERLDELQRSFVSNRISAVINQVIGCVIGCVLLFLALLLTFQDSTRYILILHLMGYKTPAIRKMLIDIYRPIIYGFFILSLGPAVLIVKGILRSLSLQIGDYMPFQTNVWVILGIFILLHMVYLLVQATFTLGIKKVIATDKLYEYTNAE
ncbi:MAG: FtsX-like permease family protein [Cellulosilyticaceae bacterium]